MPDECPSRQLITDFLRANPDAFVSGTVEDAALMLDRVHHALAAIYREGQLLGCGDIPLLTWAILLRAHADYALKEMPPGYQERTEGFGLALSQILFGRKGN